MTGHVETTDGVRLFTEVADAGGDRPWVVLSNSLGADLSMWDGQVATLATRYRVLRYDTRGHGRSGQAGSGFRLDRLVADLVAVMDHHGVGKADIVGLSLGGMTALGLGLDHPQRVGRLVCIAARSDAPPPFVQGWDDRIAAVAAGGVAAITEGTLQRWFTPATHAGRPDVVQRAREMLLATQPDGYAACAAAIRELAYLPRLGALAMPALYVAGAEDVAAPADAMRGMAAATPGARFEIVAGAAHMVSMETPAALNAILSDFLETAPRQNQGH